MSRFILHTGLQKTGTASLQLSVFAHHPQISYLGKSRNYKIARGCISDDIATALKPVLWPGKLGEPREHALQPARELLAGKPGDERIFVGSWESLGTLSQARFERVLKNLTAVQRDCGMLVCLRNASDWLPSLYLQETRGHFRRHNRPHKFKRNAYLPIEAWMKRCSKLNGGLDRWLCHVENIRTAVKLLGKENVQVLVFEKLRSDPRAYYRQIADFLDIDVAETLRLGEGVHENTRMRQAEFEYIQSVQKSFRSRWAWRKQDQKALRDILTEIDNANPDSAPVRARLNDYWRRRVEARMLPEYQWLDQHFDLDLAAHGYPVGPGAHG